jgi:hypothetical protein
MKPGFALLLSHDSIGLMQRTAAGWESVGAADLTDPDLGARLAALRATGEQRAGGPLASKLVLPDSEILYTTILAPGPNAQTRRAQIRSALEGRTPYAVKELAFDWRGTGPEVQVAVVARETLAEAEAFAEDHGFGPMSFVASPDPDAFAGEPWFGAATGADRRLKPGEKVERENDPVPVARKPAAPAPAAAAASDAPEAVTGPADVAEPVAPAAPELAPELVPERVAAPPEAVTARDEPPPVTAGIDARPDPVAGAPEAAATPQPDRAAPGLAAAATASPAAADPRPDAGAVAPDVLPAPPLELRPVMSAPPDDGPPAAPRWLSDPLPDLAPPPAAAEVRPVTAAMPLPPAEDLVPPPLARSSGIDVLSPALDMPPDLPDLPDDGAPARGAAPAIARLKAKLAETAGDGRGSAGRRPVAGGTVPLGPGNPGNAAALRAPKPPLRAEPSGPRLTVVAQDGRATRPAAAPRPVVKAPARTAAAMVTAPGIPIPRDRRVNIPAPDPETEARSRAEAEARKAARTDAGQLGPFANRPMQRGKPRYLGLILTGLLLLALAAVAAWSSLLLNARDTPAAPPVSSAADPAGPSPAWPPPGSAPETGTAAAPAAEPLQTAVETGDLAGAEPAEAPAVAPAAVRVAADPAAATAAPPGDPAGETLTVASSGPAPDATVVVSGPAPDAAVVAPPAAAPATVRAPNDAPQDEIFLARSDPAVPTGAAVALAPPVAAADAPPAPQPPPPPFGTVYQFDPEGRIVPTPEGIVTPDGVRLVAGRPPVVPPERPTASAADAATAAAAAAAPAPAATEAAPTAPDAAAVAGTAAPDGASALAAASSAGVLPAADADTAAATVSADPALAGARPRARPAALDPAPALQPATADDDAALPESGGTRITSLRPRARSGSVLAALEEAAEAAAADSAAASLAAAAIDPDASPLAVAVSRKPAIRPRDFGPAIEAAVAEAARTAEPEPSVAPEVQAAPATIAMAPPAPRAERTLQPPPAPTVARAPQPEEESQARTPPAAIAMAPPQPRAERTLQPPPEPTVARAPDPEVETARTRNSRSDDPAEVEADEPEVARAAPSTPTRASVAKQATFRNAINLSKTNLIGVYGSASNRYALVRQPNGRFVKVGVGDRVDGGRVASISERELKYVKNGRTVTLSMPRG